MGSRAGSTDGAVEDGLLQGDEEERASSRPAALELLLQSELDAPDEELSPSSQAMARWTTPNRRLPAPRAIERAARASERFLRSGDDLLLDDLEEDPDDRAAAPPERPSERSTVPTGLSNGVVADSSSTSVIELSTSDLDSARELESVPPPVPIFTRNEHERDELPKAQTQAPKRAARASSIPPTSFSARPPLTIELARPTWSTRLRGALPILVASHVGVAAVVALIVGRGRAVSSEPREPRVALPQWSPLAAAVGVPAPLPSSGGCVVSGTSRMLTRRAQIGPGLDVGLLETGFAVGLAPGATDAVALRIEGSGLRVAETVRVKVPSIPGHVTVGPGQGDADEELDVRVDSDDARSVVSGDGPAFRVVARGGYISALLEGVGGARVRPLWPAPGVANSAAVAITPEVLRAAGRDDGGAVVALRRPSMLWLGVADPSLAPVGPLVPMVRKATIGMPAVASWGSGGVVAWAEKAIGDREWKIVVAGFAPDDDGALVRGPVREIAKGMSPTIAALPDGDVLLAYADGPPGAHRVVARRLTSDLVARGEPLILSPESLNAGQPVAAIRSDGRGLVAFLAADHGRSASVYATPLACDPGL